MPQLFEVFGFGCSMVMLLLSAVLNYFGVNLLFAACYHKQIGGLNYTALGLHSLGNLFRISIVTVLAVSTFCNMTNYLLATSTTLHTYSVRLTGQQYGMDVVVILSSCMFFPFTLVRNMKNIAVFSAIAALAGVSMVFLSLLLVANTGALPGRSELPLRWMP